MPSTNTIWLIVGIVGGILFLVVALFLFQFLNLWVQAWFSGAKVSLFDLIGMRLRKVDPRVIVLSRIRAVKAGLDVRTDQLETHYLSGGRVQNVITAIISAQKAHIPLTWDTATAIDLAGRDIVDAVQTSVNPKVIDCPAQNGPRSTIDAVAQDGIQLKAKARVTVRTNIQRLVGGATEETIIARVGEGIVTTIGSAQSHKSVLENPDNISKTVMAKGLDAGTAFEILSIDIADIDVGDNIGAQLKKAQAEADKSMAQAEAESRAAKARALEQENKAKIEENKALVVLAEAEIPRAIAHAFQTGNMGVMDYYRIKNVQSDTLMRSAIAGGGTQSVGERGPLS
ncbi:MAG TPA: flotillin-like protein FloA [Phycisphaerales bacterium]|nr:flotillin-like protein FloA [Phycisphaerales bacterium]